MNDRQVRQCLSHALDILFTQDFDLLERGVAERAIAARLQLHMSPFFPDHTVDTEYDKHGIEPKRLHLPPACRAGGWRRIIPDIIVHHRGNDESNLLAIEIKKETNRSPRDCDRAKLFAMREQLHYQAAVLIELPAGAGARQRTPRLEWI